MSSHTPLSQDSLNPWPWAHHPHRLHYMVYVNCTKLCEMSKRKLHFQVVPWLLYLFGSLFRIDMTSMPCHYLLILAGGQVLNRPFNSKYQSWWMGHFFLFILTAWFAIWKMVFIMRGLWFFSFYTFTVWILNLLGQNKIPTACKKRVMNIKAFHMCI